jgi:hypothetical protein
MMTTREVAVCVFYSPEGARDAIVALKEAGFAGEDISLLTPDADKSRPRQDGDKVEKGALTGLLAGGVFGGLAGFLVGVGALAIPGAGPLIAAGALASTLGGAAIGAGLGAIAGALVGMGVPEDEAKYYEGEVRGGRSLVAVRSGKRTDEADELMHRAGGYDVQHRERTPAAGTPGNAARRT